MKDGTDDSEMLQKAFAILTSSAAAAASAEDKCQKFRQFHREQVAELCTAHEERGTT
jgi:hypothetical protein